MAARGKGETKQQPTDTVFFGGLDQRVTKQLLLELSMQVHVLPLPPGYIIRFHTASLRACRAALL